jgi:hypothetical protein
MLLGAMGEAHRFSGCASLTFMLRAGPAPSLGENIRQVGWAVAMRAGGEVRFH